MRVRCVINNLLEKEKWRITKELIPVKNHFSVKFVEPRLVNEAIYKVIKELRI